MKCFYNNDCALENTDECNSSCIRYLEINHLLANSMIPAAKQMRCNIDFDNRDTELYERLSEYCRDIERHIANGDNLIIQSSNTGNGKTTWAIQLMLAYFDAVWPCNAFKPRGYFIHVPSFLMKYKNFDKNEEFEEVKKNINNIDLVILDDIGAYKMSEFDNSVISSIIDQRILNEKSIIATTNLSEKEIRELLGKRIADRLYSASAIIEFQSNSYRGC